MMALLENPSFLAELVRRINTVPAVSSAVSSDNTSTPQSRVPVGSPLSGTPVYGLCVWAQLSHGFTFANYVLCLIFVIATYICNCSCFISTIISTIFSQFLSGDKSVFLPDPSILARASAKDGPEEPGDKSLLVPSSELVVSSAGLAAKAVVVTEPAALAPPNAPNTAAGSCKSVLAPGLKASAPSSEPQQADKEVVPVQENIRPEVKQEPLADTPAGAGAAVSVNAVDQPVAPDAKQASSQILPPSSAVQPSTEGGIQVNASGGANASGGINIAGALQIFQVSCCINRVCETERLSHVTILFFFFCLLRLDELRMSNHFIYACSF